VLAPAPAAPEAAETPVFVDDSGARKRLLRITGVMLGLLAQGPPRQVIAPEGVTVCMTSAVLAPAPAAPAAAETPVFVDDSGARKRLLRITGVLLGLLAIGFIGVVGIAIATPSVATSVGLGDVTPFVVPGAAAPPP